MSINLQEYLGALAAQRTPLWINGWIYGEKLLCKGAVPWSDVAAFVSFFNQLQGLLKSDVLTIDLADFYKHWLASHPALLDAMGAKSRLGYALRTLLADPEARRYLKEIIGAICEVHKDTPVLVSFPSPRYWVGRAHCQAKQIAEVEVSWQDAESGAMYLADFLREFSSCSLSGIALLEEESEAPKSDEEIAHYRPLLNVAKHYGWSVVLDGCADSYMPSPEVGVSLCLSLSNKKAQGRKLSSSFWDDGCASGNGIAADQFWHVDIPADAVPEKVLDALATLREKS